MKIIDLTHPITPHMPVYPGTEQPEITTGCSIDKSGFLEKKITFYSHTGTHIDAPAHLLEGHRTLDMLAIEHFHGPALLVSVADFASKSVDVSHLTPYRDKIRDADFLLLHTGWSKFWGDKEYFAEYPVLSVEAADWLCRFDLKGVGLDTISADPADSPDYQIHKILLQKDTIIIENLANLNAMPCRQFTFSCFPLKFTEADGSPVRAVAFLP